MQLSKNSEALSLTSGNEVLPSDSNGFDLNTFNQVLCLELQQTGKDNVLAAVKLLEQRSDVLCVGPNYIYELEDEPEYLVVDSSSYLPTNSMRSVTTNDTHAGNQWAIEKIGLSDAWEITTGANRTVTVGIFDDGVDASHPDLEDKVNAGISITFNAQGTVSTPATDDPDGHGTMIARIIGADTDNNEGISGVNWNVELVSIRMEHTGGVIDTSTAARAIDYARSQGIKLLNISYNFAMSAYWTEECTEEYPVDLCLNHVIKNYPGLIICSAGNGKDNIDNDDTRYPSSFDLDNIIVVGASTPADTVWSAGSENGSNYGANRVDLFAPGVIIYSTMSTDVCTSSTCSATTHLAEGYHRGMGTSYAAPYVTGVASLIWAKYPSLSAVEVKNRILNNVDVANSFIGKCSTGGRLNAYKALHNHTFSISCEYGDIT